MRSIPLLGLVLASLAGCGGAPGGVDPGAHDAAFDATALDATVLDAAVLDASVLDATVLDATALDAAALDAAALDGDLDGGAVPGDAADAPDGALDGSSDAALDDGSIEDAGVDAQRVIPDSGGSCTTLVETHPIAPAAHVAECSPITYATTPPTSGDHYPRWAAYRAYDAPIAAGFVVHGLEHGAAAITYRCDTPCPDDLAALAAYLASRPPDPRCGTTSTPHQIVVAPDPTLDVRFAAAAWGVSLRSDCFDIAALDAFLDAHVGHAPEDTCSPGTDVLDPRWGIPADCGL